MQSFLDRYYEQLDDYLGDPVTSKRLTTAKRLRDLNSAEQDIWAKLLRISGQNTIIGRLEATITIKSGTQNYPLPGNFRQFLGFELRNTTDPDIIEGTMSSIMRNESGPGVEILGPQQGIRIRPMPDLSSDQDWTLIYQKGPVILANGEIPLNHIAEGDTVFRYSFPKSESSGTMVTTPDYYVGSVVRIYDGKWGVPQSRTIVGGSIFLSSKQGTFIVDFPFNSATGTNLIPGDALRWEIQPLQPEQGLDEIYAVAVALKIMPRRTQRRRQRMLADLYKDKWEAVKSYWLDTAADRPPRRMLSSHRQEVVVYDAG